MTFDRSQYGRIYQLQGGELYSINSAGEMAYAGALTDSVAQVTLTGYSRVSKRGTTMWLTVGDMYIDLADGWQAVGYEQLPQKNKSQAQAVVDQIIRNNKTIVSCNLLCARFADKLTRTEKAQLYALQERLEERNERLKADGLVEGVEENYPAGYVYLNQYLEAFMSDPQNGVGSLTVTIIVAAVVIASLSTAAYYAYRYYAKQSEDDVKFSKELTETLMAKLTPEEYEQLKKETAGIVTKARIKQTLSTVGTEIKIIGAAAAVLGGYILYKQWQSRRN